MLDAHPLLLRIMVPVYRINASTLVCDWSMARVIPPGKFPEMDTIIHQMDDWCGTALYWCDPRSERYGLLDVLDRAGDRGVFHFDCIWPAVAYPDNERMRQAVLVWTAAGALTAPF